MEKTVHEYTVDSATYEGWFVSDSSTGEKRPGVVVVHQWMGITDYELMRAEMLASRGYNVFVADMYGKGIRPANVEEAAQQAGAVRGDIPALRSRINAAVSELRSHPDTDTSRVAAIGYCFGGGVVLELARSGADVSGVVSFHGLLSTPDPADANNISCSLLVCHGDVDPYVPDDQVAAFLDEMRSANVDCQFISYGGAVHAFTQPMAGDDPSQGAAYDKNADKRSWQHMLDFFAEKFD